MDQDPATPGEAEILAWLQPWIPRPWFSRQAKPDPEDILGSPGLDGDDADEVILAFSKEFGVDLTDFNPWLYYVPDEPPGRRRWHAVNPDTGAELPLFPLTIQDLVASAHAGVWTKTHPPHRLEENPFRFDLRPLSRAIAAALVLVMLPGLIAELTR